MNRPRLTRLTRLTRHPRAHAACALARTGAACPSHSSSRLARWPSLRRLPGLPGVWAAVAAAALAACSQAPLAPQADVPVPPAFKRAEALPDPLAPADALAQAWKPAEPADGQPRGAWWTVFADPALDALQDEAARANPTLAGAAARVQEARALLRAAGADRLPQLGLSASTARQRLAPVDAGRSDAGPGSRHAAGLVARYELDLFGRIGSRVAAAQADAQAVEADYRSVLLVLQADVAQAYFELRTLDAEIALLEATVRLREETARLIARRFDAGDVAEIDVARSRADLATVQAEAEGARGARARAEHALAVLLGRPPAAFDFAAAPLPEQARVPQVPAGLPSALLERRPDVAAAQRTLQAATARVGEARSALFPALALTAEGGHASSAVEDLFKWSSRAWLVSAVLSLPILDGGRNQAAVDRAQAALEGAVADYRQRVLAAFADVEDSLATLRAVRGQAEYTAIAAAAARRATELADKRYRAGEDSVLQLIDTQRESLALQRQAVRLRGEWAGRTVELIRALGGGWQAPQQTAGWAGGGADGPAAGQR